MKYLLHLCFLGGMLLSLAMPTAATTYYVSNNGNDSNSGTSQLLAWKTMGKVNSVMSGLVPGDSVLFKCGDVFKERLNITKSGSASASIVFSFYGSGAKPLLDGKDTVSTWSAYSSNIWRAYYPSAAGFVCQNLFKNGQPLTMGRWPNEADTSDGYKKITGVSGTSSVTDNTISGSPNWTGGEIVIRFNHWSLVASKITSHSGSTLQYTNSTSYTPYSGWGYFIQNHVSTLDTEGEWYYDTTSKYVYLYSLTNPSGSLVEIAARASIINLGTSVSNIVIDGIACKGASVNAISGNGTALSFIRNIQIKYCDIYYAGQSAISLYRANKIQVKDCYIYGSNFHGISIHATDSTIIEGNTIKASALIPGRAPEQNSSIRIGGGANAVTIQNNYLDSTGYGHIVWSGANHLFKNNLMKNYCMRTDDGAAVYCFGNTQLNNRIDQNIIMDGKRASQGIPPASWNAPAAGIYTDEGSANISITNNTIARSFTGVNFNAAAAITTTGNTFFANNTNLRYTRWTTDDPVGPMRNYVTRNNILFGFGKEDTLIRIADVNQSEMSSFGDLDSNFLCTQQSQLKQVLTTETATNQNRLLSMEEWKLRYGHDSISSYTTYSLPFNETLNENVWFDCNASGSPQSYALPSGSFKDAMGNSYSGTISIGSYQSKALYKVMPDSVFAQDNLVVVRLDSVPVVAVNGTANKAFLDEFDVSGKLVKSLDLSLYNFYVGVKDMAEGIVNRSANGEYLVITGYTTRTGITGSTTRAVASVKYDGSVTITTLSTTVVGNNAPRGAISDDGTNIWLTTTGTSGILHATGGGIATGTAIAGTSSNNNQLTIPGSFTSSNVFTTTSANVSATTGLAAGQSVSGIGIPAGTTVSATSNNTITLSASTTDNTQTTIRVSRSNNLFENLSIYDGQLYYSANAGYRIGKVGDGLPTTTPDKILTGELFGPTANGPSSTPEQVFITTVGGHDVMYVATQTGGINKYQFVSGIWMLKGSYSVANVAFTGNAASGSNTISSASSVSGLCPGMFVTGTGINAGTYITGINGGTLTLSSNATATNTSVNFTGRNTFYNVAGKVSGNSVTLYAVKNAPLSVAADNTIASYSQLLKVEDNAGPSGSLTLATATTILALPPVGDAYRSVSYFDPVPLVSKMRILPPAQAGIKSKSTPLKLYPNPAVGELHVSHARVNGRGILQIYSMQGVLMCTQAIFPTDIPSVVRITSLPAGSYIIVLSDSSGKSVSKFMKAR